MSSSRQRPSKAIGVAAALRGLLPPGTSPVAFLLGLAMVAREAFDARPSSDLNILAVGCVLMGFGSSVTAFDRLKKLYEQLRKMEEDQEHSESEGP